MELVTEIDAGDGVAEMDDAIASKEAEKVADADPSTAKDENKTGDDTLSLLREVVKDKSEAPAASSASEEAGESPADGQAKEPDNESYSDVPFNKHPRFQEVLGKLRESQTDATRYRNVQNYIDDQGLGAEEAAELLLVGGMMKRDPAAAWERIKPTIQNLLIAAGEVLPENLKERVAAGEMSREAAIELSRVQAQSQSMRASQTFDKQREKARRQTEHQTALTSTATSWAEDRKLKDPNFDAKQPALLREIAYLQATEGKPTTVDGVKDQLKRAYDAVTVPASAAPVVQKREIKPVRGGQVAGTAQRAPETTMEILQSLRANAA